MLNTTELMELVGEALHEGRVDDARALLLDQTPAWSKNQSRKAWNFFFENRPAQAVAA